VIIGPFLNYFVVFYSNAEMRLYFFCSAAVVQHVRKMHPELADGTATEPPEDDREHSYFNRKVDVPPRPPTPPPAAPAPSQPVAYRPQKISARRGRRRRLIVPTVEKDHSDRYLAVAADRRERRMLKQQEKEHEEKVKRLRKWTCARSRTYDEHREMGRGNVVAQARLGRPIRDDGTDAGDVIDMITKQLPNYPILDHPYAREEIERGADRLQALWNGGYSRSTPKPGGVPLSTAGCTPQEVSAFQECETALLGLGSPTSRGGRGRRGRGRGRGGGGGYGIDRRVSSGAEHGAEELDHLDPDIRDLDLLAESELLLRPAGDYSIIQDILGSGTGGVNATRRLPAGSRLTPSPLKLNAGVGSVTPRTFVEALHRSRSAAGGTADNGLADGLPTDEVAADLDDIELCEDDYRLFNTTESEADVQHPPPIPTAVHMGSADGTVLTGSISSGIAVPTSWRSGREEYAARSNAASFLNRNRTPPTFSLNAAHARIDALSNSGTPFFSKVTPPAHDVRIPSDVKAARHFDEENDDACEGSLSDASQGESAAELDSSTDTASPSENRAGSSPLIDDDCSRQSLSDDDNLDSTRDANMTVSDEEI
jgi:hypothetical protein